MALGYGPHSYWAIGLGRGLCVLRLFCWPPQRGRARPLKRRSHAAPAQRARRSGAAASPHGRGSRAALAPRGACAGTMTGWSGARADSVGSPHRAAGGAASSGGAVAAVGPAAGQPAAKRAKVDGQAGIAPSRVRPSTISALLAAAPLRGVRVALPSSQCWRGRRAWSGHLLAHGRTLDWSTEAGVDERSAAQARARGGMHLQHTRAARGAPASGERGTRRALRKCGLSGARGRSAALDARCAIRRVYAQRPMACSWSTWKLPRV